MKNKTTKQKTTSFAHRHRRSSLSGWLYTLLNKITLWFVGKYNEETHKHEIQGIFLTRKMAIKACRSRLYYVLPLKLNNNFPDVTIKASGQFYPIK